MRWTKDNTNILNTLSYISLSLKDEQDIELYRIMQSAKNINAINKNQRYSSNYRKLLKRVIYLSELNGLSKWYCKHAIRSINLFISNKNKQIYFIFICPL